VPDHPIDQFARSRGPFVIAREDPAGGLAAFIAATFPRALRADVEAVASVISAVGWRGKFGMLSSQIVSVDGEPVRILYRQYADEPSREAVGSLSAQQQLILSAVYSRHHDGLVRERHLERLFVDVSWTPHLLLSLVSEYVIQIGQRAVAIKDPIPVSRYASFAAANSAFMAVIRSRVVSYWSVYYDPKPDLRGSRLRSSSQAVKFDEYPGYRFLAERGLWTGDEGSRLVKRSRRDEG
jgi:hypothetical protein